MLLFYDFIFNIWLIGTFYPLFVQGKSNWTPCKVECDGNFGKTEAKEQSLINVCHRGCDMFTVALITTTDTKLLNIDDNEFQGPKALPQTEIQETNDIIQGFNIEQKRQTASNVAVTHASSPSSMDGGSSSPSKTTAEPTSQPVQDHPVEANKQTSTTTNGPKHTQLESAKKENGINVGNKQPGSWISIRFVERNYKNIHDERSGLGLNFPMIDSGMSNGGDSRLEQAKHSCRHACVTAYGGAKEQEACAVGCHLQAASTSLQKSHPNSLKSMLNNPFNVVQRMFFNMRHLVKMAWPSSSTNNQKNEEQIQAYGSEDATPSASLSFFTRLRPHLYIFDTDVKRPSEERNPPDYLQSMNSFKTDVVQLPRFFSQPAPKIIEIFRKKDSHKEPHQHSSYHTSLRDNDKRRKEEKLQIVADDSPNQNSHQPMQQQLDLLECISRKSGLPRWFIATTIFASALVVLWLCFSLTAPPEDIRVIKTNVKPPESDRQDDEDEYEDTNYLEKKNLLSRDDDVIKIRIENV